MFQGEEKNMRPRYWSDIDQQERCPGDMCFQYVVEHNSPVYAHTITQSWLTGMKQNDVPIPLSIEMKNIWYWMKSYIHPEYIWITKTKRFNKIRTFIEKVIDFFMLMKLI